MGILEGFKDVRYRIRIFDNGNFIMSAEVPDKGQRNINVTVHQAMFGIGERTRLAFQINPKIKPKIFEGKIMEVDFDIRDSTQLGDLLDVCPELVYEIDKNYKKSEWYKKLKGVVDEDNEILNADFTVSSEKKEFIEVQDLTADLEEEEDKRPIDTVINGIKEAGEIITNAAPHLPLTEKVFKVPDEKKAENIRKCMKLIANHPKLLYWLPGYLKIEPEITAIVSQSRIYRAGIQPSYYIAQTGAMIAEKILTRPKEQTGYQQIIIIIAVLLFIIIIVGLIAWLLHG